MGSLETEGSIPSDPTIREKHQVHERLMTKQIVIYHKNCPDGFTAAWACWKSLGDEAEYYARNFNDEDIPDVSGADTYIVDFSYPRDILLDLKGKANSLVVLDHHATAKDHLDGIEGCHFDMDRSGAGMAWDYFNPDALPVLRSPLVNYVEDRDLWRFNLPYSKEINAWITSHEFDFETWSNLNNTLRFSFEEALNVGQALLRGKRVYVAAMKKKALRTSFLGYEDIPVVNAPHISISELVGSLAEDAEFAVGWHQLATGDFLYSLRSRGDFDVRKLAEKVGGGGHPRSAGFNSALPPWELPKLAPDEEVRELLEEVVGN